MPDVIDSPADAEAQAAVWMIGLGFADAMPTQFTADGGIDVIAARAVAQVKFQVQPVGRPALQNLVGAAADHPGKFKLFFAWKGYSGPAYAFAEQQHVALFSFTTGGDLVPENTMAEHLCSLAQQSTSADLVGVPRVPAPRAPQYPPPAPPSAPPAREWIDWFTRRRIMRLSVALLVLCAVLFFATHTDLLIQLLVFAGGCYLCWYGVQGSFGKPKRRSRSRSRRRR